MLKTSESFVTYLVQGKSTLSCHKPLKYRYPLDICFINLKTTQSLHRFLVMNVIFGYFRCSMRNIFPQKIISTPGRKICKLGNFSPCCYPAIHFQCMFNRFSSFCSVFICLYFLLQYMRDWQSAIKFEIIRKPYKISQMSSAKLYFAFIWNTNSD